MSNHHVAKATAQLSKSLKDGKVPMPVEQGPIVFSANGTVEFQCIHQGPMPEKTSRQSMSATQGYGMTEPLGSKSFNFASYITLYL